MTPYLIDNDKLEVLSQAKTGDLEGMLRLALSLMSGLYTNKDLLQAEALFTAMLGRDSELSVYQRWEAQGGLGVVRLQLEDFSAALEWFQKALATMTTAPVEQWNYTLLRLIANVGWSGFVRDETLVAYLGH